MWLVIRTVVLVWIPSEFNTMIVEWGEECRFSPRATMDTSDSSEDEKNPVAGKASKLQIVDVWNPQLERRTFGSFLGCWKWRTFFRGREGEERRWETSGKEDSKEEKHHSQTSNQLSRHASHRAFFSEIQRPENQHSDAKTSSEIFPYRLERELLECEWAQSMHFPPSIALFRLLQPTVSRRSPRSMQVNTTRTVLPPPKQRGLRNRKSSSRHRRTILTLFSTRIERLSPVEIPRTRSSSVKCCKMSTATRNASASVGVRWSTRTATRTKSTRAHASN